MMLPRSLAACVVGLICASMLMVLSTPAAAASGTLYGTKKPFSSDSGITFGGYGVSAVCSGAATWVAVKGVTTASYSMKFNAQCKQMLVAGLSDGPRSIRVVGLTESGEACTRTGGSSGTKTSASWWDEVGMISLGTKPLANAGAGGGLVDLVPGLSGVCAPTRIHSESSNGGYWSAPIDLEVMPEFAPQANTDPGVCEFGMPKGVDTDLVRTPGGAGSEAHRINVETEFQPGATGTWKYRIVEFRGGIYSKWDSSGSTVLGPVNYGATASPNPFTGQSQHNMAFERSLTSTQVSAGLMYKLAGVVWWHEQSNNVHSPGFPANIGVATANSFGTGVTDAGRCVFWFGDKLYNDEDSTADEPWGSLEGSGEVGTVDSPDLTPAPLPPDDPDASTISDPEPACEFNLSDPSSWLSGGMCSAVGLLGRLVELLLGIFNTLVALPAALLEAVGAVFVPEPGALEGQIDKVNTAWSESSPGEYFTAFGGVANAARFETSGCAGPSFTFSMPGGFGGSQQVEPLNACSGGVATVAGVVKAGLTLTAYIGAALVALRVLGAAFGLNLNGVGAGRDD